MGNMTTHSNSVKLLLAGMVVLIILNYFIFTSILDQPHGLADEATLAKKVAVDILEIQLARKENRIKELEAQVAHGGGSSSSNALVHSSSYASSSSSRSGTSSGVPRQTLTVGWEWPSRATRRVRFWDGKEAFVYKTTYEGSMANPNEPGVDWWDRVETRAWEIDTFFVIYTFLNSESSYIDFGTWIGPTLLYGATRVGLPLARSLYFNFIIIAPI